MPMNRSNYPPDWEAISAREREAAGNKCRRCGVPNHITIFRRRTNPEIWVEACDAPDGWRGPVYIILTVGHVDQDPQNNHPDNLRLWCQRCHLNFDRPFNIEKIKRKRVIASGQFSLRL